MTGNRVVLLVKAVILRVLMRIGMFLHGYPMPWPPRPSFKITLPCPSSSCSSPAKLLFYTPRDYPLSSTSTASPQSNRGQQKYPVVVNFHGGGFCLGSASDDARWARMVVNTANAVVVSVDYRLAPEWPFPAAVDDGVDALLYLKSHAEELCLDISRVALTGFSAGGNLAFTVPLRLHSRLQNSLKKSHSSGENSNNSNDTDDDASITKSVPVMRDRITGSPLRILSITSWYPVLDFVVPRHVRRSRSAIPSKTLPSFLTSLFDKAYLPRPADSESPYSSPLRAEKAALRDALPADIFIYMCEWDMLVDEGKEFVQRLEACDDDDDVGGAIGPGAQAEDEMGVRKKKRVRSTLIEQSVHAWDKSANPFRDQGRIDVLYMAASEQLKRIFETAATR